MIKLRSSIAMTRQDGYMPPAKLAELKAEQARLFAIEKEKLLGEHLFFSVRPQRSPC